MFKFPVALVIAFAVYCSGWTSAPGQEPEVRPCTVEWFRLVEETVPTGDGQGHGPDPGSLEWMSVVEFKLGIRDDPGVPPVGDESWCRFIDERFINKD